MCPGYIPPVRRGVPGEKPEEEIHILASGSLIQARLLHHAGETTQAQDLLSKWEMHARFPWSVRAIRTCQARLRNDEI